MPAFIKSPKFIVGSIGVLWLAYIIYANFQLDPVRFYLLPFDLLTFQLRVSAVVIGATIFGSGLTLLIQFLWNRRSSKNASSSAAASAGSSKTVA